MSMGRIVSFFGSRSRCGTSQTALSLALKLAGIYPEKKILLIHMEEAPGDEYTDGMRENMGTIRPLLENGLWAADEIFGRSLLKKNFYAIGGAGKPASAGLYHPAVSAAFLTDMAKQCDFVICDCGSDLSHGLCIGALTASDTRCLVIDQSESSLRRYEWMSELIRKIGAGPDVYVINGFMKNDPCDTVYVSERLRCEIKKIFTLPFSKNGREAELCGRPLAEYKDRRYSKALCILTEYLASDEIRS